jgi:hypothetical protein
MRREFGRAFSILVGLIAALMMFSNFPVILCVLCGENPIDHRGHREKQKTAPPKNSKRMERSRVAVSPFDGVNRIRFKGSLALSICDFHHRPHPDSQPPRGSPETLFDFQSVERILGRFPIGCKPYPLSLTQRLCRGPNIFHAKSRRKFERRRENGVSKRLR